MRREGGLWETRKIRANVTPFSVQRKERSHSFSSSPATMIHICENTNECHSYDATASDLT